MSVERLRALGAASLVLLAAPGCVVPSALPEPGYSPCRALGSSDWKAEVQVFLSAHPKPLKRRKLIVTGKVTVPEGYGASIDLGPVSQLDEPVQQILIRTEGSGAADGPPVTYPVRGVFPALKRYGGLAIRCGDGIIAEVSEVSTVAEPARGDN